VVVDQHRWRDDWAGSAGSEDLIQVSAVVLTALREGVGEEGVSNELRLVLRERPSSKNVVGMDMRHHYIPDRQARRLPDGRAQTLTINQASARIHHGNRIPADDESDVGYGPVIGGGRVFVNAASEVDSRGNFVGGEGLSGCGSRRCSGQSGETAGAHAE
jgi:hypothetical protein